MDDAIRQRKINKFYERRSEAVEKERRKNPFHRPTPLSSTRERSLTLPLPANTRGGSLEQQLTLDQVQSDLFTKLPLEVRKMISRETFGGFLHVTLKRNGLLTHKACEAGKDNPCQHSVCWDAGKTPGAHVNTPSAVIPLLQTCRKVYVAPYSLTQSPTE